MDILVVIIPALIATILIEYGVLIFLRERRKEVLWSSVVVNILTNVPLNLWMIYLPYPNWTDVLMGEIVVVVVETLWYYWFVRSLKRAFTYGFLCNAISFLTGLLVIFVVAYFVVLLS